MRDLTNEASTVQLLYDPQQFTVTNSKLILSTPFEGDTVHLTRGFLIVDGRLADERVCVIVNHWPSRGANHRCACMLPSR